MSGVIRDPKSAWASQHLARRHPPSRRGMLDLGAPPVGLRLGDPAQAVRADPKPPLDDDGPEPRSRAGARSPARPTARPRGRGPPARGSAKPMASRTTFSRSMGIPVLLAQLAERRAADLGEPIERARIQEGERERSVADGGGHPLERHAGPLQARAPIAPCARHPGRRRRPAPGRRIPSSTNRST